MKDSTFFALALVAMLVFFTFYVFKVGKTIERIEHGMINLKQQNETLRSIREMARLSLNPEYYRDVGIRFVRLDSIRVDSSEYWRQRWLKATYSR